MCRTLLVTLVMCFATLPVHAINFQDLWWNKSESGWGVNIAQQADILFATWFIYGPNRDPYWVVMPGSTRLSTGANVYQGTLYQTRGTHYPSVPFVPLTGMDVTPVGSATFDFTDTKSGTLTYTINNQTVIKQIERQFIAKLSPSGTFYGGFYKSATGCTNDTLNGSRQSNSIYVLSSGANSSLTINEIGGDNCRFTGSFTQYGSLFEGTGTYTCLGATGSWTGSEGRLMDANFSMKLSLTQSGETCTIAGSIGGFNPQ